MISERCESQTLRDWLPAQDGLSPRLRHKLNPITTTAVGEEMGKQDVAVINTGHAGLSILLANGDACKNVRLAMSSKNHVFLTR